VSPLDFLSRYLSLDDLWSVLGYCLMVGVNQLMGGRVPFAQISTLASGMLAMVWMASPGIRARNSERYPNARVAFWAAIAVISLLSLVKL
jgi:hypothetical protein